MPLACQGKPAIRRHAPNPIPSPTPTPVPAPVAPPNNLIQEFMRIFMEKAQAPAAPAAPAAKARDDIARPL